MYRVFEIHVYCKNTLRDSLYSFSCKQAQPSHLFLEISHHHSSNLVFCCILQFQHISLLNRNQFYYISIILCEASFDNNLYLFCSSHKIWIITRGDHVSWSTMDNMIPTMMMINISKYGNPTTSLIHLYNYKSTTVYHIQATQSMGDVKS
jgi:hypothetical protein